MVDSEGRGGIGMGGDPLVCRGSVECKIKTSYILSRSEKRIGVDRTGKTGVK